MSRSIREIVIVGSGQAGYQAAMSLREEGFEGNIRLVGEEPHFPYQRPPLSKEFLKGNVSAADISFATADEFEAARIDFTPGEQVVAIDRAKRSVILTGERVFSYDHLILATGADNVQLPWAEGVFSLRGMDDASSIGAALSGAGRLIVKGGGFIGLELAAVASARQIEVDVVESSPAPMRRGVSAISASAMMKHHEANGVRFHLERRVSDIRMAGGSDNHVILDNGSKLPADVVVGCIGVQPRTELALAANLPVANGILVDGSLLTEDPDISAIGDCAAYPSPFSQSVVRLESVQNAADQARFIARRIVGTAQEYSSVPWFWSDQGVRLQIAGLAQGADDFVVVGDQEKPAFSVFCFRNGQLVAVESVNRPADHMAARRLLATRQIILRREVGAGFDLKERLNQAA